MAAWKDDGRAAVDPRVLEDTADGKTAHFLVVFQRQANARGAAALASDRNVRGRLVVEALRQAAGSTPANICRQVQALGARCRPYWIVSLAAIEGDRATVDYLASRPQVKVIEPDRAFRARLETPAFTVDMAPGVEWNLARVRAPEVWAAGYTGQGIVYANADTGVEWNHPALKSGYRGWDGATADHNYNWWDAIHSHLTANPSNRCPLNSRVPCDDYGHGTHTVGTGVGDDGAGNQIGVAPGSRWIACRNMEDGVGRPSTYIDCLQFFLAPTDLDGLNPDPDLRPDVVGNSYGCPPSEACSPESLLKAVDNLRAAGVFLAASAGNYGTACGSVQDPPGLYDSVTTVGATDTSGGIASFSSRGPVAVDGSGRLKPDLVAPGVGVRSSYLGGTYASMSGTSMAAPHLAGTVALLWSAFPALRGDVNRTESIVERSAHHLLSDQGCGGDGPTQVPNNVYGYGLLDAKAAFDLAGAEDPTPSHTPTHSPTPSPISTWTPTPTLTPTRTPASTTVPLPTSTWTPGPTPTHPRLFLPLVESSLSHLSSR